LRHHLEHTKCGLGHGECPGCRRTGKEAVELDEELEVWVVALWGLAVAALNVMVVEICDEEFLCVSFFLVSLPVVRVAPRCICL